MKKISLFLLIAGILAACHNSADDGMYYDDQGYETVYMSQTSDIKSIETGGDRDMTVETAHHVIQMVGNPGTQYKYYVWTGNKNTETDDPDVIVDRGNVMVRQAE